LPTKSLAIPAPQKRKQAATVEDVTDEEDEDYQPPKRKRASLSPEAGPAMDDDGNEVTEVTDLGAKLVRL
jgi:hypothetical protein